MKTKNKYLAVYDEQVKQKYLLYNSLFLTLPFEHLLAAGVKLPLFSEYCQKQMDLGKNPQQIVNCFFKEFLHIDSFAQQSQVLFIWLQFIERQIVLFDALEEAAFPDTHDKGGAGTLAHLERKLSAEDTKHLEKILQTYRTRIVLTAHPTQFYPAAVLGIIDDLAVAVKYNDIKTIHLLLLQMGKTPFKSRRKPTPFEEAEVLVHRLENVFYPTIKKFHYRLRNIVSENSADLYELEDIMQLGFWPGGDRDGNPYVTSDITLEVAARLKYKILDLYMRDIKKLKRRLTFRNVYRRLKIIQIRLRATQIHNPTLAEPYKNSSELLRDLNVIRTTLLQQHRGLFLEKIDKVISAVLSFGFHFASMDLRQDSSVHEQVVQQSIKLLSQQNKKLKEQLKPWFDYTHLAQNDRVKCLRFLLKQNKATIHPADFAHPICSDVLLSLRAARHIQLSNGEKGLHRYIISNTKGAYNVLEIMLFVKLAGLTLNQLKLDVIPLFETIVDLKNAEASMQELFEIPEYRNYLKQKNNCQIVMLGFSDGTKDGGYFTANWSIYQCKKKLFDLAKQYDVKIIFFDGRGGPPARGGGNTHLFYRASELSLDQLQIQLTIQGQTISSNFGSIASASYNLEQLFTSALEPKLFLKGHKKLDSSAAESLLKALSMISYRKYQELKQHPAFIPYLEELTPLKFYGELNIASRPPRRKKTGPLTLKDLRAIPFVGAWSQMKQNIPGYYGLGNACQHLIKNGKLKHLQKLYHDSLFFHTLIGNAMQSLAKSYFPLTQYLAKDKKFGKFWALLQKETALSVKVIKAITKEHELLEKDRLNQTSIKLREDIVLPLLIIQQYALMELRSLEQTDKSAKHNDKKKILRKIVLKSLAANINASRNSA